MTASRMVLRIAAVSVLILGLVLAVAAGAACAYQAARITPQIDLLFAVLLAVFFACSLLVTALAAKLWQAASPRGPFIVSTGLTILFAIVLCATVLRPTHAPTLVPFARANTRYLSLPSGSRIAYSLYQPPSGVPVNADPIVFLHGGPGLRADDYDHRFYSQFAQDGFKVYVYDQVGSGLSDRLPEAKSYTMERFIADLESIRQSIGAQRMILIGHSWGGTLAAHYAAAHPDRVAKLVLHSPGPIWMPDFVPLETARTAEPDATATPPLRILATLALSHVNLRAAENLVSQQESGAWLLSTLDPRQLVCKGQADKLPHDFTPATMAGANLYPLLLLNRELTQKKMDVQPQLSALHVPVIALFGQCDFIPWTEHSQYKHSIPGLQEYYFENAGHYIDLSQPEKLAALLRSFLLDKPPAFAPYPGDKDPRPPLPLARNRH